jgi:hypothetical protein
MIWRWPSENTLGMWTLLYWTWYSRTQFGVSINVWKLAGDNLNITWNFLYCNHQVHRDFVVILYYKLTAFRRREWLGERVLVLYYTYLACLYSLSFNRYHKHWLNIGWEFSDLWCWGWCLGLKGKRWQGNEEDYTTNNCMFYKGIPLQAWTGPEGSMRLRLLEFLRQSAHEDGTVVSPTHRPPLPPEIIPGTHFC